MVTFQTLVPPNHHHHTNTISEFENHPSKKRKWNQMEPYDVDYNSKIKLRMDTNPNFKTTTTKSSSPMDLHLEAPLPSNWQRCLDIQSGEIHLYNTRTHKTTQRDPRVSKATPLPAPIPEPSANMGLDLELNLTCGDHHNMPATEMNNKNNSSANNEIRSTLSLFSSSSPATADKDHQEMVAAACKRCHLLVMLCKSYPACPNCKFIHPRDQIPPNLLKPRINILC